MDLSNARGLTIKQPWASLIASGAKTVENRTWSLPATWTPSGPLFIHAGHGFDRMALGERHVVEALGIEGWPAFDLPHGLVLAVVETITCHQAAAGCCTSPFAEPDGWHWMLAEVHALSKPMPATGRLGLWKPDDGLIDAVARQLTAKEA